jgi:alpha-beta hydrolase superfamily lysophospholipase
MIAFLDQPDVLAVLFYPRTLHAPLYSTARVRLLDLPVEPGLYLGGRLYPASASAPLILYFHGNGEVAADYDDLAPLYTRLGISLLVVDYRGYGRSGGQPTGSNLLTDAAAVVDLLEGVVKDNQLEPPRLYLMGRSLGSAAALEAASQREALLAGLIIESGFSDDFALLARLGLRLRNSPGSERGFGNLEKISRVKIPTLVIHGESDTLIPVTDGKALFEACGAKEKRLVTIPGGHHNDVMMVDMQRYFGAIKDFVFPRITP